MADDDEMKLQQLLISIFRLYEDWIVAVLAAVAVELTSLDCRVDASTCCVTFD